MGIPLEHFTTIQSDTLLWFEKLHNISNFDIKKKNLEMPTIAIRMTAWGSANGASSKLKEDELIVTVPYSNHCSSSELKEFLDFVQPQLVERIVQKQHTPHMSVIDFYSPVIRDAMTDDSSCSLDSAELSSFDGAPFKTQRPHDYFQSAVNHNQSPAVLDLTADEMAALSEDMDSPVAGAVHSPLPPPDLSQKPGPDGKSIDVEGAVAKASRLLSSINSDLKRFDDDYIYTEPFLEKLIALTKVYQPVTGIGLPSLD